MSSISRINSLNLKSVGDIFIDNYLETVKGFESASATIKSKSRVEEKAYNIYLKVIEFNDNYKSNFKKEQWTFIENSVLEKLYCLISKDKLNFEVLEKG